MWKTDWNEAQQHYLDWWNHKGLVLRLHVARPAERPPHEVVPRPPKPVSLDEYHRNAKLRAWHIHYQMARGVWPADAPPTAGTDIGPGSLALFCGCEPGFAPDTVWFVPCWKECADPECLPPIRFDASNPWWRITEETLRECAALARGRYLVGCPDLVENLDILAALREPQELLMDMIERPEWVSRKIEEITALWFDAYQRVYDMIKTEDGGAAYGPFGIWGPGKTAKVQCDASAMFSPAMFERFVVPCLTEQCRWLDYSMYHLDGTHAIPHLDALLRIEELDAVQWSPQSGLEPGGHPRWHPLYRRILDAGKSVHIGGARKEDLPLLFDALGKQGLLLSTSCADETDAEAFIAAARGKRT